MKKTFIYYLDNSSYEVEVTYKLINHIYYRFDGHKFKISSPFGVREKQFVNGLDKFAKGLIKKQNKNILQGDGYIYLFGEKYELTYPGYLNIEGTIIDFKNQKEMQKKITEMFLEYLKERCLYYEQIMNVPFHQIKIRKMKTLYGSNNFKMKILTFNTVLMHYAKEIIDSVIIHELCHYFVHNHSQKFYNVLDTFCPSYHILRKKLIKQIVK